MPLVYQGRQELRVLKDPVILISINTTNSNTSQNDTKPQVIVIGIKVNFQNSFFHNNMAERYGGAIMFNHLIGNLNFLADNVTLQGNVARGAGATICIYGDGITNATFTDCNFLHNIFNRNTKIDSIIGGGSVLLTNKSIDQLTLTQCNIDGNMGACAIVIHQPNISNLVLDGVNMSNNGDKDHDGCVLYIENDASDGFSPNINVNLLFPITRTLFIRVFFH